MTLVRQRRAAQTKAEQREAIVEPSEATRRRIHCQSASACNEETTQLNSDANGFISRPAKQLTNGRRHKAERANGGRLNK